MKHFLPKDYTGLDLSRRDGYELSAARMATRPQQTRQTHPDPAPAMPTDASMDSSSLFTLRPASQSQGRRGEAGAREQAAPGPWDVYRKRREQAEQASGRRAEGDQDDTLGVRTRLHAGTLRLSFALAYAIPFVLLPSYLVLFALTWLHSHPQVILDFLYETGLLTWFDTSFGYLMPLLKILMLLTLIVFLRCLLGLWRCAGQAGVSPLARYTVRLLLLLPVFQFLSGLGRGLGFQ